VSRCRWPLHAGRRNCRPAPGAQLLSRNRDHAGGIVKQLLNSSRTAPQGEAAFLSSAKAPRVAGWHWSI
jgi:hypothetical protein